MSRTLIIIAIASCYFVFAILLNSVGTVILQSIISFDISKPEASVLEGFKDLSIALVSFFVASLVPRIGYKFALLGALILSVTASILTPIIASFIAVKLLFACIGVSFALIKVSVYSVIGQITNDTRQHTSLLNTIEGIFMLGVLSGYWIFSVYINEQNPASLEWLNVYYLLAGILAFVAVIVLFAPIQKPNTEGSETTFLDDFIDMLKLSYQPLVLIFVISIFLYVLVEQGIGTWLPTFNNEVLKLPVSISIQITSLFAAMIAIGRLLAGQILKYVHWYIFLNICLLIMAVVIIVSLPLAEGIAPRSVDSIFMAPIAAYMLPLIGLVMAPIYPALNSVMLSSLEKNRHAPMTGLIVVFSALGGTTGSIITGFVFESFGGQTAFYLSLIPILLISICLYFFRKTTAREMNHHA